MKKFKNILLLLAATALTAVANAQVINGGADPFAVDNSLIVGTWYKSAGEKITFNSDGTTNYIEGATYKFRPIQGTVLFYNGNGVPISRLKIEEISSDYMVIGVGSSGDVVVYTSTKPDTGIENDHAYVDLGLSVKWATMNVGASSSEDFGDYFAWGETTPKTYYWWETYKWYNGSDKTMTKYCTDSSYGTVDNKTVLDLSDDAARSNWGGTWRMPTDAELTELRTNCTWTWTTQNGVNGYKVTSKTNGNSIFLPAAGFRSDSSLYGAGSDGYYRSSSLDESTPNCAWDVYFDSSDVGRYKSGPRLHGQSIRPVCP